MDDPTGCTMTANFKSSTGWTIYIADEQCETRENSSRGTVSIYAGNELEYTIDGSGSKKYTLFPSMNDLYASSNSGYEFVGWYVGGSMYGADPVLYGQDLESVPTTSIIYAAFKSTGTSQSANVKISLINSSVKLEGSNVPSEFGCDMADCKIYKLQSTNGITGILKLKTAYSHPGYSITSSNSYIPYVTYRKDDYNGGYDQSNVTYNYYEWTVNGISSGTLSLGNGITGINTSLKVGNITYTLIGE